MAGILIVDDDPTIRTMFARALKSAGDVETAANGGEALRLLGAKKYGVVLLDLHMPVIDGFLVLQTLAAKQGPNHDTPIYVVTADTSEQARLRALRRHALFILTKPVPLAMLTSLVEATLKKAAARAAEGEDEGAVSSDPTGHDATTMGETPPPPIAEAPKAGRTTSPMRPVVTAPITTGGLKKPGS